jgi:acetyltransferase-like isoleucine patch superfamily enzyme
VKRAPRSSLLAIRLLSYLTNHFVSHIPSFSLRAAWYRALGLGLGPGSGIHMGCYLWFYGPHQIRRSGVVIGRNSRINRRCLIDARGSIRIGDNVSISPEVAILTTQHRWDSGDFELESRNVVIDDHVWIGTRATVMPGTHIGRGAVVAAGAVATGQIPPLAVVAGVPARVITKRPETALRYELNDPFPLFE